MNPTFIKKFAKKGDMNQFFGYKKAIIFAASEATLQNI